MRKALKILDPLCLTFLLSLLVVATLFSLVQDILFFKSDILSILNLMAGSALLLFLVLCLPVSAFVLTAGDKIYGGLIKFLCGVNFSLILFGFAINFLADSEEAIFLFARGVMDFDIRLLSKVAKEEILSNLFFPVCGIILALSFLVSWRVFRSRNISHRITLLSRGALILALGFLLLLPLVRGGGASLNQTQLPRNNVILIVLDGLSAKYLEPYNPEEKTPFFSEMASQGRVYANMRTNITYTSGFFYVVYSGQKKSSKDYLKIKPDNLLSRLQAAGVQTRWYSFHNNGVPDIHNFTYKGLRSSFLAGSLAWYPKLLGMNYNVFEISGPGKRGRKMGYREEALVGWVASVQKGAYLSPLENVVIQEIQDLRDRPRPFFALVHLPIGALTKMDTGPTFWQLEDENFIPQDRIQKIKRKILKTQQGAYSEEDAPVIALLRQQNRDAIRWGTRSLKRFFDRFKENGWDKDTLLIVTADHGKIFSKGKFAYQQHNEEEVTRVPFLLFWNGEKGVDDRMGDTADLTQTLLDFFQIPNGFDEEARSLLEPPRKKIVTSLTDKSIRRMEMFLNVYKDGFRYVINLFPGNFYIRKEAFTDYFNAAPVKEWKSVPDDLGFDLKKIVSDYGIEWDASYG